MAVMEAETIDEREPLVRLSKDLKLASAALGRHEARYLVDLYYQMQENRKRANNQIRATSEAGEPGQLVTWVAANMGVIEKDIRSALAAYAEGSRLGRWCLSIYGIGPVITAGLVAHIDIERAPTAGHIWRFAGLDPTVTWNKGEKRPWNADLKVICWKAGDSFVKFSNKPECLYGRLYRERKAQEVERNEAGMFAEQAARALAAKKYGKDTEAFKAYIVGKLPPAHLDARARRWSVKVFLSHFQAVAYELHYGRKPPFPYVIEHMGHGHMIQPPECPE